MKQGPAAPPARRRRRALPWQTARRTPGPVTPGTRIEMASAHDSWPSSCSSSSASPICAARGRRVYGGPLQAVADDQLHQPLDLPSTPCPLPEDTAPIRKIGEEIFGGWLSSRCHRYGADAVILGDAQDRDPSTLRHLLPGTGTQAVMKLQVVITPLLATVSARSRSPGCRCNLVRPHDTMLDEPRQDRPDQPRDVVVARPVTPPPRAASGCVRIWQARVLEKTEEPQARVEVHLVTAIDSVIQLQSDQAPRGRRRDGAG